MVMVFSNCQQCRGKANRTDTLRLILYYTSES
jgi:hypothetical protein